MTTDLSRLDLPDGAWATFRTRYGWGPSVRIQAVLIDGDGSEAFMRAMVRETVTAWHLPTESGGWHDFAATADNPFVSDDAMDLIDATVGDAVLGRCNAIWRAWRKGRPDPKDTNEPSTATPPAPPSA
jgi:hypothetical protein